MRRLTLALLALLACLPATAAASMGQESTFQDDDLLVFGTPEQQADALDTMKALGADRVRVSVFWREVAPDRESRTKPAFDAADPAAYPPVLWERYDRILRLARERGLAVNFDVTGPGPLWAMSDPGERPDLGAWYGPSAEEFGQFVTALGRRYSGDYQGLPRVDYWSIWNEPNQPGWLAPQWLTGGGRWNEAAPRIYRDLADAMWSALQATGHTPATDTILVGELAPKGLLKNRGVSRAIDALRFLRGLYCVGRRYRALRGRAATRLGCPSDPAGFAGAHPALFEATGFAHHPYELNFKPSMRPRHGDWVTIANLTRLSTALSRALRAHGRSRVGGMPLYLTEFGYQTNPPDRLGVSFRQQAGYLNQSEFIAYVTPQVRTLSQFLLIDDDGDPGSTFQSGLMTRSGKRKPAYAAYRLPIYLPSRRFERGETLRVWGLVRPAANGEPQRVGIQFRRRGRKRWRTVRTVTSEGGRGYVDARVRVGARGAIRLAWRDFRSRRVRVKRVRSRR
jgi:hypothetical protein